MPAVVSDSSPLVYLSRLGRFALLGRLFQKVLVPPAVWQEVAVEGGARPEAGYVREAAATGWLRVETPAQRPPQRETTLTLTLTGLDQGEREAIVLAQQRQLLLLIDERAGREAAMRQGVDCMGTLGLLTEFKLRGLIPQVRCELERLRARTNFRFTEELFELALQKVGEDLT